MRARYADGRIPLFTEVQCDLGAEAIVIATPNGVQEWRYADLRRTDDGNGRIAFKRKPDTGERLSFDDSDKAAIKAAAPALFAVRAQGVESPIVVAGVFAAAWSLAGAFLVGVPMAAEPIAAAMPVIYRDQIAEIAWSQVNATTQFCDDSDQAADILNAMALQMMEASNVAHRDDIWITIVDADFPNAFALPDDSIIVTDELIAMAEHPDEVTGVLAHEIAHIERNHVMKNIIRQVGAGVFFDVVFGGAGAGQAIALASVNLAGLRYTRGDEEEADSRGLDYMAAANIDPAPLAALFDRIRAQMEEMGLSDLPTLLSSHPATAERAAAARARARPGSPPSLTPSDWAIVRQACGGGDLEDDEEAPVAPAASAPVQTPPAPAENKN